MAKSKQQLSTFREHLEELRRRLLIAALAVAAGAAVAFVFHRDILRLLLRPARGLLPVPDSSFIVTDVTEMLAISMKISLMGGFLLALPVVVYQVVMFIAPGLRPKEKRTIFRLVAPSILLFALGVAIAFFVVLPFTFDFLYQVAVNLGVGSPLLHIDQFLDFILMFMLGFGLAFQVPIIMYGLTAVGLVRAATWKKYWRLAVVAIFAFGAIITPDGSGVTMLLVSLPMAGLYVAGYVACVLHERKKGRAGAP